jgi:ADP-ribose pyrophosphatase YjhB (NUDIX family)
MLKRSLARTLHRFPVLYTVLLRLVRATAARFTVGAVGVVFNSRGEVLVAEHVFRDRSPWGLPGGWVRRHEEPRDALRPELQEEMGLEVRVGPPLLVELGEMPDHLETGFLCQAKGEMQQLSFELFSARWVAPDSLPPGLRRIDRQMVRRALALRALAGEEGLA